MHFLPPLLKKSAPKAPSFTHTPFSLPRSLSLSPRGNLCLSVCIAVFAWKGDPSQLAEMWQKLCKARTPLALMGLCFAMVARSLPLTDAGPHVNYGWGEPVRLRHLYTAGRHGLFSFLRINGDGRVDGTGTQSLHSEYHPGRATRGSPWNGRQPPLPRLPRSLFS